VSESKRSTLSSILPETEPLDSQVDSTGSRLRTWPAVVILLLLPGLTAEALTGSTPILVYLTNPVSFVTNTLLYGGGALLIREVVRRRGLGWWSVLLLGAAYGVFEEGLVVNTWANPWLPQVCTIVHGRMTGVCDYGRLGGINVCWALSLTIFHAVVSITIPILLVELIFPARARLSWFGTRLAVTLVLGELLLLALGLIVNVVSFHYHRVSGPPVGPYLVEIALMAVLIWLALTLRTASAARISQFEAPHLWTLRILAGAGIVADTLLPHIFQGLHAPFQAELIANTMLLVVAVWNLTRWSQRRDWSQEHRLALASGTLGFFILIWAPILELSGVAGGNPTRGTIIWAAIYLIFLIILARRTARPEPSTKVAAI
jgi:hypothetical protein